MCCPANAVLAMQEQGSQWTSLSSFPQKCGQIDAAPVLQ